MTVRRSLGAGVAWMAFGVRAEALAPAMDVGLAPAAGHDLSTAADAELGPSADAKVDLAEDLEQGEEQSSGSKIWTFLLALGSFPAWGRLPVRSKNMSLRSYERIFRIDGGALGRRFQSRSKKSARASESGYLCNYFGSSVSWRPPKRGPRSSARGAGGSRRIAVHRRRAARC
ncbi:unnamed protein product [Prorocentrum cordatum]|uniref:Uncharacterized protein n=1 Tax=Prorocentrum cordatum TaxID=2364126 RepID=A0ABN9WNN6_9DINO|nr:unnamed protein product [Polarella glacialis]